MFVEVDEERRAPPEVSMDERGVEMELVKGGLYD